jgi:MinD-like ATPase involved in chromosome partitioning or flagellar assembly
MPDQACDLRKLARHSAAPTAAAAAGPPRRVMLVTTPEAAAILDTFAAIKLLVAPHDAAEISVVVSRARDEEAAEDVYRRLAAACHRFLAVTLDYAGWVPSTRGLRSGGLIWMSKPGTLAKLIRLTSKNDSTYVRDEPIR